MIRALPQRFEARLLNLIDYFLQGLIPLRSPKTLALLFSLSVPVWLFETGLFFFIGYSFGLHEVYYDDAGKPYTMTQEPADFWCDLDEWPKGIQGSLIMARTDARRRPVLDEPEEWPGKAP